MQYILDNPGEVLIRTLEHLRLVGLAVLIATLIGAPLGILISRVRWLELPVLNVSGILYTIPSLALFAFLIPYSGLGLTTATIALAVYSLLAIVRNTAAGLDEVPRPTLDAAQGMGMTTLQVLRYVQLPLALPYMLAGIRIATVAAVNIGVIASQVGAGGLGLIIFEGIRTPNESSTEVAGATAAILLALVADFGFSRLALVLRPDMRASAGRT